MSTPQNIFQQLAQQNDDDEFSGIVGSQHPETEFSSELPLEQMKGNIFEQLAASEKQKQDNAFGFLDTAKDIGKQVIGKGTAGLVGAYGNLLDAVGLQTQQGQKLPGQEAAYSMQSDVLDKIHSGQVPSVGELSLLSEDDILPQYSQLPTSQMANKIIEKTTGIGQGKTALGRIAGRGAEFLGEGSAFPGGGVKSAIGLAGSGIAGQSARELNAPESLASGIEIAGSILPSAIQGKLAPSNKEAKKTVDAGRALGLTEQQITPLVQREKKAATLSKVARKGTKTKEIFESIKEKLGDSYNAIKSHKIAKVKLDPLVKQNLNSEFSKIRDNLSKTLASSPDRQAALEFIDKAINSLAGTDITPEHLVNFWQDINKSVKWNSIQGGKKALTQLKKPISEALERVAPNLAKDFEMTNDLYSKYSQIAKKLKPDIVDSFVNKGEILAAPAAGLALLQGNPWVLSGLTTESAIRILGREMLINPYFQNIGNKLVKNFNNSSMKGVTQTVQQVKEYMMRKHPNEDWGFLTKED